MRIAIEATQALSSRRGWGRYNRDLLRGLVAQKRLDLAIFYHDRERVSDTEFEAPQVSLHPLALSDSDFLRIEEDFRQSYVDRELAPDVYHSITEFPWYTERAKLVVTIHELTPVLFPKQFSTDFVAEFQRSLDYSVAKASALVAVSEQTRNDLTRVTGVSSAKVHVIPNGVNETFFGESPFRPVTFPYVLYVGALNKPSKNAQALVPLLAHLPEEYQLVIVCDQHDLPSLGRKLAISPKQTARIRIIRQASDLELLGLYQGAALLFFPSYYEGFGFPVFEALAAGCPVLCADAPAHNQLAKGYCEVFDPLSFSDLGSQLRKCLANYDPDRRSRARDYVRSHMTWGRIVEQYVALYEKIAN